jgi:alpha-glucosidase (family GH31 glycosyl hydrolase)
MEYEFPHQGMAHVNNQFMLGSDILVAPVLEKGKTTRTVYFPDGTWRSPDGTVYTGGGTQEVSAPLEYLPFFIKG